MTFACWCGREFGTKEGLLEHGENRDKIPGRYSDGRLRRLHVLETMTAEKYNEMVDAINRLQETVRKLESR